MNSCRLVKKKEMKGMKATQFSKIDEEMVKGTELENFWVLFIRSTSSTMNHKTF